MVCGSFCLIKIKGFAIRDSRSDSNGKVFFGFTFYIGTYTCRKGCGEQNLVLSFKIVTQTEPFSFVNIDGRHFAIGFFFQIWNQAFVELIKTKSLCWSVRFVIDWPDDVFAKLFPRKKIQKILHLKDENPGKFCSHFSVISLFYKF